MRKGWTEVALGEVLRREARPVEVIADQTYREIGIRSHGKGIFHKEPLSGLSLGDKRVFWLKPGDFVLNIVFAWEGAVGVIGEDEVGMIGSHRFPTFHADDSCINPRFLVAYFRTRGGLDLLGRVSPGGAGRNRTLSQTAFLNQRIPLPPLAEQQRIVAHLDAIESRLTRAQKLREESALESLALIRSMMQPEHCQGVQSVPMHELVTWRSPDVSVSQSESYPFAGVYCFGRGVFKKEPVSGMDFAYERLTRLRAGEFTFPKLMAWEGALGIVPPDCDGCHVSPEFPVFTVDESKVLPEILDIHFKTPAVWKDLAAISTGTNLRRRRLNPNAFLGYEFPLPPMKVQKQVKAIAERAAAKRRLQSEAVVMEKALLPSLLDRLFND